mgnify:CR=1 FL=1
MKLGKLSYLGLTLTFMGLVFYLSDQPRPLGLSLPGGWDKILHSIEYAILGYLLARTLTFFGTRNVVLLSLIIGSLYGLGDEIHQHFVPGREASGVDLFFDSIGTFLGAIIGVHWRPSRKFDKGSLPHL